MKASVDKLRWVLAGGSLFLLLLLFAAVGYGRYRAAQLWNSRLNKLGVHIEQTTNDVTYSQTIQGRTVFTLRAGKAIQRKDGKTTLHNVQLTLYGKKDGSEDRIYGSEFEYDEKAGVARAIGAVEMDLRIPGSLATKNGSTAKAADVAAGDRSHDIHVRTSGLTYVRKLGVAATDEEVTLTYAGLECTAKGAEFNSGDSIVHLLANVEMHGSLRGKQLQLHAAKADLNHGTNAIVLAAPHIQSGTETATATNAVLQFRHDGSLETAQAEGAVTLQKLTRQITAARMESRFSNTNAPEQASLSGGVRLLDTDAARPMRGAAVRVDGVFDGKGSPVMWKATGGAQLETAAKDVHGRLLFRSLQGDKLEASMRPRGGVAESELSGLHVSGKAQAFAELAVPGGTKSTRLAADDLVATFLTGKRAGTPELQQVVGTGHTRLQQNAPGGAEQISTGDRLQLRFTADNQREPQLQIANAIQEGNVILRSHPASRVNAGKPQDPISASADRSVYDGAKETLSLTGRTQVLQGSTRIAANAITIDQRTGDSEAEGNVLATLTPSGEGQASEVTHISSDRVHLDRAAQVSSFRGTDDHPARLWQGPSKVEAANITVDGKKRLLNARPDAGDALVHAIFTSAGEQLKNSAAFAVEKISASTMDYYDATRVAALTGNVVAQGATGQVRAENAQLYFSQPGGAKAVPNLISANSLTTTPSFGGSMEKAVLWGNVQLSQPGKTGHGERLIYTAADSTFRLTGSPAHPPQVVDSERGSVTGATLLFHSGDNRVVVSGAGAAAETNMRVHTETGAKQ